VTDAAQPEVYFTSSNRSDETGRHINTSDVYLIVRASSDPERLVPTLRDVVRAAAPTASLVESVMTMKARIAGHLANPRISAALLGAFAVSALLIAGVGLFGVLSYVVVQRTREVGVRMALGARPRDVVALVVRQSMVIVAAGLALGIGASYWASRLVAAFLYGVTPHDPLSYAAVPCVLFAVAAVATVVPARRAARLDPAKVLRA
jgi:ABC-type antimicrobial peptide transport system permease subunit